MASFAMGVIRGVFRAADHIAPRLAGRIAFEIFCRTANPAKPSAKERRALAAAVPFMDEARHHRLPIRRGCVAVHEFRPFSGGWSRTVLVVHGWSSRSEHMRALVDGFRAAGVRVIALDLPGHGASTGRRLNMAVAVEAVATAEQWFGPFEVIIGHSFGGAVAVNAAVGSVKGFAPVRISRLVLLAAPSSLPMIFEDFGRFLNLGPRTQTDIADRVYRIAGRPLEDYVGQVQLAENQIPTLVLHAADDKEVSPEHARGYARAGDHVRLAWVNGLGHRRILADPGVVVQAVDFGLGDQTADMPLADAPARQRSRSRSRSG